MYGLGAATQKHAIIAKDPGLKSRCVGSSYRGTNVENFSRGTQIWFKLRGEGGSKF